MALISIDGKHYEIPTGRVYTIVSLERQVDSGKSLRTVYQFNLPNPKVQISRYEEEGFQVAKASDIKPAFTGLKLFDRNFADISDFMLASQEVPVPEKLNLWPKDFFYEGKKEALLLKKANDPTGEAKMPQYLATGTRVKIPDPIAKKVWATGTVVEYDPRLERAVLAMDQPQKGYGSKPTFCGANYGFTTSRRFITPLDNIRIEENLNRVAPAYEDVPLHIGVYAPEAFEWEGLVFPSLSTGRFLGYARQNIHADYTLATISWSEHSIKNSRLWNISSEKYGVVYNCWTIPTKFMLWCRLDPIRGKVIEVWPCQKLGKEHSLAHGKWKTGDFFIYKGNRPIALNRDYIITRGVVLEYLDYEGRGQLKCKVRGGLPKKAYGALVIVRDSDLTPLQETYIGPGRQVEIVADVVFRKRSLQGSKAVVILPTDEDGDVGLEFPDDIEAGSLDGAGQEGRCLYVPVSAVKEVS